MFDIKSPLDRFVEDLINNAQRDSYATLDDVLEDLDPVFQDLHKALWPQVIHCNWGALTSEEQVKWETAIVIMGQAEKAGNQTKWQEMAKNLLSIGEAVSVRLESSAGQGDLYAKSRVAGTA
jgi:hypothetical protein